MDYTACIIPAGAILAGGFLLLITHGLIGRRFTSDEFKKWRNGRKWRFTLFAAAFIIYGVVSACRILGYF